MDTWVFDPARDTEGARISREHVSQKKAALDMLPSDLEEAPCELHGDMKAGPVAPPGDA